MLKTNEILFLKRTELLQKGKRILRAKRTKIHGKTVWNVAVFTGFNWEKYVESNFDSPAAAETQVSIECEKNPHLCVNDKSIGL